MLETNYPLSMSIISKGVTAAIFWYKKYNWFLRARISF